MSCSAGIQVQCAATPERRSRLLSASTGIAVDALHDQRDRRGIVQKPSRSMVNSSELAAFTAVKQIRTGRLPKVTALPFVARPTRCEAHARAWSWLASAEGDAVIIRALSAAARPWAVARQPTMASYTTNEIQVGPAHPPRRRSLRDRRERDGQARQGPGIQSRQGFAISRPDA